MSFEDDFPSLMKFYLESEKVAWDRMSPHQEFQRKLSGLKEQIKLHCLDKQRVREAIEKPITIHGARQTGKTFMRMLLFKEQMRIKKELGL